MIPSPAANPAAGEKFMDIFHKKRISLL